MHYYKLNISDWNLATAHLSLEEEAVYFRLINFYYDSEQPIPIETQSVIRRLRLGSHSDTVGLILNEFFVLKEDGWHKDRCDLEIDLYHNKADANKENGKKGGRPKKINNLGNNPEITQTVSKNNPDITLTIKHKPITNNQEPRTKNQVISATSLLASFGIEGQVAKDFVILRNKKDAPITETSMTRMKNQAAKAGVSMQEAAEICIERNWQGFNAEWYGEKPKQIQKQVITEAEINRAARPGETRDQVYKRLQAAMGM